MGGANQGELAEKSSPSSSSSASGDGAGGDGEFRLQKVQKGLRMWRRDQVKALREQQKRESWARMQRLRRGSVSGRYAAVRRRKLQENQTGALLAQLFMQKLMQRQAAEAEQDNEAEDEEDDSADDDEDEKTEGGKDVQMTEATDADD